MAINFLSLEKSELELNDNFLSLVSLCRKMYIKLATMVDNKIVTQESLDKMEEYHNRVNESRRDIRDDCIWIISKDQPRASHLRYIIAVLYSIKDIERMSDYAYTISRILKKEKITTVMVNRLSSLLGKSIDFYDCIIDVLSKDDLSEYEEKIQSMFNSFRIDYKNFLTNSIELFSKTLSPSDVSQFISYYFNFSIIIKYIDRIVDHCLSIYKNFVSVKNR
ncbi:PhoU domain-containing protein [Malacoplasma muris]|uniref:PhoU domain-containing protein n=1 Tax=Malacoplasma muris TaxID=2119 RepID=UPI00398EADA6